MQLFSFFTIQSNVIAGVVAAMLALDPLRDGRVWRVARLDALLGIVITGLVFDFVLAPLVHLTGWALVATVLFHYVMPWGTLLAWLVLGPRRRWSWVTVVAAFVWPVAWLVYTFVRGAIVGWYPYPFLDAGRLGLGPALLNSLLVVLVAVLLAVVFTVVDRRVPAAIGTPDTSSADSNSGSQDGSRVLPQRPR
ncbi:Pr6Pr family membrane protein [Pseudonocardia sp. WMMC193]|uniref:Pr6Pr family membrane protein n=1 Tax=Pseudonocardia sp. WMMC193 TaxID=2911965 RepID=UPI001F02337F|nr:Pr6Pr family membrane protein [Pseudonocardia sp. WMMC193]MCF7549320.1 Pr6Pr family membrane protein [Pseudonocardia sp. WMMC193]